MFRYGIGQSRLVMRAVALTLALLSARASAHAEQKAKSKRAVTTTAAINPRTGSANFRDERFFRSPRTALETGVVRQGGSDTFGQPARVATPRMDLGSFDFAANGNWIGAFGGPHSGGADTLDQSLQAILDRVTEVFKDTPILPIISEREFVPSEQSRDQRKHRTDGRRKDEGDVRWIDRVPVYGLRAYSLERGVMLQLAASEHGASFLFRPVIETDLDWLTIEIQPQLNVNRELRSLAIIEGAAELHFKSFPLRVRLAAQGYTEFRDVMNYALLGQALCDFPCFPFFE